MVHADTGILHLRHRLSGWQYGACLLQDLVPEVAAVDELLHEVCRVDDLPGVLLVLERRVLHVRADPQVACDVAARQLCMLSHISLNDDLWKGCGRCCSMRPGHAGMHATWQSVDAGPHRQSQLVAPVGELAQQLALLDEAEQLLLVLEDARPQPLDGHNGLRAAGWLVLAQLHCACIQMCLWSSNQCQSC